MDEHDLLDMDPPPPEKHVERIRFFAKVLAYGVMQNRWSPVFIALNGQDRSHWACEGKSEYSKSLGTYLRLKWQGEPPHSSLMVVFGYFQPMPDNSSKHRLTLKAFQLLEEPSTPPSVFISYRRNRSSAFGLLIVARLQAKGIPNPFIDMSLEPGDIWHAELEEKVRQSRYFVCLIAPETLSSEYVITEIRWALSTPTVTAIPIWHNGFDGTVESEFDIPADIMDFVKQTNAIVVNDESAKGYNTAVVELLNGMGYAP